MLLHFRPARLLPWLLAACALFAIGCGYSEDEWRAKLRDIENLKQQLAAEQDRNQKVERELADAKATIEQLQQKLGDAGLSYDALSKEMEEKARALEEYKKRAAQLDAIRQRFDLLRSKLQGLTKLGLTVTVRNNRMVIELPGDVLFDSGRETLKREGESILGQVAAVVRRDADLAARTFQVAGHTDDVAYAGTFKDNWGLSVMRAREVLAFLIKAEDKGGGGLDPKRWSAAGYGDTDPVATNDSPEHRQKNRRCELILVPNVEEMLDIRELLN